MSTADDPTGAAAWEPVLDDLADRRRSAEAMGGEERLARRRAGGKLDARARVAALCDPGSVVEIGRLVGDLPADAFVAAIGTIDGRPAAVGAEDFTVAGGSIGTGGSAKRHRLAELAGQERMPLVMLLEGAGHRPPTARRSADTSGAGRPRRHGRPRRGSSRWSPRCSGPRQGTARWRRRWPTSRS